MHAVSRTWTAEGLNVSAGFARSAPQGTQHAAGCHAEMSAHGAGEMRRIGEAGLMRRIGQRQAVGGRLQCPRPSISTRTQGDCRRRVPRPPSATEALDRLIASPPPPRSSGDQQQARTPGTAPRPRSARPSCVVEEGEAEVLLHVAYRGDARSACAWRCRAGRP
jgi:hypothetical protein